MERLRIYDNGGQSFDRYTVVFAERDYALGIGCTGNVPNGFCMTVDVIEGDHLGPRIERAEEIGHDIPDGAEIAAALA